MRFAWLLGCLLSSACGGWVGTFPPPVIPASPTAEDWPDAGAAVIEDVSTLRYEILERDGQPPQVIVVLDHRRRLKVLSETGLAEATVALPVDGFSTVTRIDARAVAPNGSITTLDPATITPVVVPGLRYQTGEVKQLRFVIPGATQGGLLEYRYERVYVDPDMVPVWVFGGPLPVMRAELGLIAGEGIKLDHRYGRGEQVVDNPPLRRKDDAGRERWVFVEKDLPAYYAEPAMPHLGRLAPWVAVVVTEARFAGLKRKLKSWEDVGARMTSLFAQVGGVAGSGPAKKRFAQIASSLKPLPLFGLGVRQPVSAAALAKGEPVCTRDATALLLKALEGVEQPFYPALLAGPTGPVVVKDLPGFYPFVRAGVAMDVTKDIESDPTCEEDPARRGLLCTVPADSYAFLDPLCTTCRFGEVEPAFSGGTALVFTKDEARWVDIPIDSPEKNRTVMQYRWGMEVDGALKGGLSGEMMGAAARHFKETLVDERKTNEVMATFLFGEEPPVELKEAKLTGQVGGDETLKLKAKATAKLNRLEYQHFTLRAVDVAGPSFPGRLRASRRQTLILDAPLWNETVVAIELPVGYDVTMPEMVKVVEPFAEYASGFAKKDRTLSYTRRLIIKTHLITPEMWPAYRAFLEAVRDAEEQVLDVALGMERR